MNIGIFTDTYEPQINGVVTNIKTSIDFLAQNGHSVFVFAQMFHLQLNHPIKYGVFLQLYTRFNVSTV